MDKKTTATPIQSDFLPVLQEIRRIPEFLAFASWCALPSWDRTPETQKELAEHIGVCQDTLTDWKRHPEFWPLVLQLLREWMREHTSDIIGGLYEKITSEKGGASDVRLFLGLSEGRLTESKRKKK